MNLPGPVRAWLHRRKRWPKGYVVLVDETRERMFSGETQVSEKWKPVELRLVSTRMVRDEHGWGWLSEWTDDGQMAKWEREQ